MAKQSGPRIPIFGGIASRKKLKESPSVGTVIKEFLKEHSMTIDSLSKKSEVKIYVLSKVINNVRKLDDENARKLEQALDLPEQFLVKAEKRYRDYVEKQSKESLEFIESEEDYSDEQRTKPLLKTEREIAQEYKNFHRSMRDNINHIMIGNLEYILLSLAETYAVIAKVVNLNIRKYTETMFQSVDREIKKDFCILTIFEWGRGLPEDSSLNHLGCAIKKLYTTEEIEKRLQEIGSV